LFKYARNTGCIIHGTAERCGRAGLLSEKEPRLDSEESRKSELYMIFGRETVRDFFRLLRQKWKI
jgi:hypothetical protein